MDLISIIGTLAAIASTASFAPQAWKIIRRRHTGDISAAMYAITVTGFALWLAYGSLRGDWPLIIPNALCFLMSAFILTMTCLPQRRKEVVAELLDPTTGPQDGRRGEKGR